MNSTEAKAFIPNIDRIFASHGIPDKIKTDNGPPFNGNDFSWYMQILGINWTTSTSLWPQGNSNVESFMKPLGKLIQTSYVEGKNWKRELNKFLLQYRTAPHTTMKVPPCELLFNRQVKGQLPQLIDTRVINNHKFAKENIDTRKQSNKDYQDKKRAAKEANTHEGDIVICKQKKLNKTTPLFSPEGSL